MEFVNDYFLKPVEGQDDVFAFWHDFTLEGKALDDGSHEQTVTEEENGDLIIEGWAASFDGLDRENENFVPDAFTRGVKAFLSGQSALCFHHKRDHGIGTVLDLQRKAEGLWMKARVDYQPESSPLRYIYNAVKKGSYKGLSIGGFLKRGYVNGRRMITDLDFSEISVTPVAVHPKTKFAVIAGKALGDDPVQEDEITDEQFEQLQLAITNIGTVLDRVSATKPVTPSA